MLTYYFDEMSMQHTFFALLDLFRCLYSYISTNQNLLDILIWLLSLIEQTNYLDCNISNKKFSQNVVAEPGRQTIPTKLIFITSIMLLMIVSN